MCDCDKTKFTEVAIEKKSELLERMSVCPSKVHFGKNETRYRRNEMLFAALCRQHKFVGVLKKKVHLVYVQTYNLVI